MAAERPNPARQDGQLADALVELAVALRERPAGPGRPGYTALLELALACEGEWQGFVMQLARLAHEHDGVSKRRLAEIMGVSHTTLNRYWKASNREAEQAGGT